MQKGQVYFMQVLPAHDDEYDDSVYVCLEKLKSATHVCNKYSLLKNYSLVFILILQVIKV